MQYANVAILTFMSIGVSISTLILKQLVPRYPRSTFQTRLL